jgi:hypothetical protein
MLASIVTGCGYHRACERVSMTLPWDGFRRVVVHTRNGAVTLVADGGRDVRITGTRSASAPTRAEAQAILDRTEIRAGSMGDDPSAFFVELHAPPDIKHKPIGASLDVHVPAPCPVEIITSNGRIVVRGMKDEAILRTSNGRIDVVEFAGRVDVVTSNGRVSIERVKGDVEIQTSNGGIEVHDVTGGVEAATSNAGVRATQVRGDLRVPTSNGRIIVRHIEGKCELTTSNGSIEAKGVCGNVKAITSNGGIRIEATPPPEGRVTAVTSNAGICLELPVALRGRLELRTTHGHIRTVFGDARLTQTRQSEGLLEGAMNGGGDGSISAHTSNASITVTCR